MNTNQVNAQFPSENDNEAMEPPQVVVKFRDDIELPYEDNIEKELDKDGAWSRLKERFPNIFIRRLFTSVEPKRIQELVAKAEERDRDYKAPNFLTYFVVVYKDGKNPAALARALAELKIVQEAYVSPKPARAPNADAVLNFQNYLKPSKEGINAASGWGISGGYGDNIRFIDLEKGWDSHNDLPINIATSLIPGSDNHAEKDHGTKVLGVILAQDSGSHCKCGAGAGTSCKCGGIAKNAITNLVSEWRTGSGQTDKADAIMAVINFLSSLPDSDGSVLLIESQSDLSVNDPDPTVPPNFFPSTGNAPIEVYKAEFDAIELATSSRIVVIEAAGNSLILAPNSFAAPVDLDSVEKRFGTSPGQKILSRTSPAFKDSKAIFVGAGTWDVEHQRTQRPALASSMTTGPGDATAGIPTNYGSRIDCYAWGEYVTTTNTGNIYTSIFDGTSSASAIIAGVALVVQGIAKANGFGDNPNGTYMPATLRTILSTYGTPSNYPPADLIGIMPDLQEIIKNVLTRNCIPRPQTASGAFSGPPDWLAPAGSPQRDKLDDPRWTGALHQGFPVVGGTSEHTLFRALYDTVGTDNFLYLSWWVKVDGSPDPDPDTGDHFYIGFQATSGGTAMVIKIVPFNSASSDITNKPAETIGATTGVGSITTFTKTGSAAWVAIGTDPSWINNNTRVWLTTSPIGYAVQMRVPLQPSAGSITNSAGPNLSTDFRMWYSMRVALPGSLPTFFSWPDRQKPTGSGPTEQFPDPNIWGWYHLGTSGCANGVSLSYDDIGTTNTPTSRIRLNPNTNRLFARPKNASGNSIPAQTIKARFRLANWGSMITYLNAPWDDILGGAAVPHSADYPTGTSAAPGQAPLPPNPPTSPPNPTSTIWFDWPISSTDSAPYINGTKNPDQCMIVSLIGAGVTFTQDSACRNMTFDTVSVSAHTAHIDIRGLAPISSQPRDVYILVEKINMPTNTPAGYSEGKYLSTRINRIIAADNSEDPNSLGNRLRAAQKLLAEAAPEATSDARLVEIMAELRLQLAVFRAKDEARNKELTERLVSLIGSWLSAVKQDAAARKRLTMFFKSWASWLRASAAGGSIVQTVEFIKALSDWLSAINSDPASSKYLPQIGDALRQWLANLVDDGSISKLSVVIESLLKWFNSDRPPAGKLTALEALREWLAARGRDENMGRQKLAWIIQGVIDWLSPATDRLVSLTGALSTAGVIAAEMEKIFPTCRFHAYHDTGRREARRDGRSVPILEAQIPFGYWLYHEDDLKGWTAILEGATRLAENFYVIKVPNNGSTQITTKIQAVEQDEERIPEPPIIPLPPDENTGCCIVIATWLDSKGPVGKILASVVYVLCRVLSR